MQKLSDRLGEYKKKAVEKPKGPAHKFQEVALELKEAIDVPVDEARAFFAFVKRKMNDGLWWKIKEVKEQMIKNQNRSLHYFMKALSKENVFKQPSFTKGSGGNNKAF